MFADVRGLANPKMRCETDKYFCASTAETLLRVPIVLAAAGKELRPPCPWVILTLRNLMISAPVQMGPFIALYIH